MPDDVGPGRGRHGQDGSAGPLGVADAAGAGSLPTPGPPPGKTARAQVCLRSGGCPAAAADQECPSSAVSSSPMSGTEPESRAGRSGKGSTRVSSMTGAAGCGGLGMTAASEWPPQP